MDTAFYSPIKLWPRLVAAPEKLFARSDALPAKSVPTSPVYLTFGDFLGQQENRTALSVISVSREQIIALLGINSLAGTYELAPSHDIILEQAVVKEYAVVPEVTRIYTEKSQAVYIFEVFMKSSSYSDGLMDILLEKEYNILEHHPRLAIAFHYFPCNTEMPLKGCVAETAKLIFRD